MKFQKLKENVNLPVIKTKYSAGMDICSAEDVTIKSGQTKIIGTGLACIFHPLELEEYGEKCFFILELRSSLRAKGLTSNGTGIIDMDYQDEWKVIISNNSPNSFEIKTGDRIAQAVFMRHGMSYFAFSELRVDEERKGGLGSTGR